MSSIYAEHILDHYKHPRKAGVLPEPNVTFNDSNPLCGDTITITLAYDSKGTIVQARHLTQGCAISQAAASMLFEELEGKSLAHVLGMKKETILEELGTELSVSRVKCALLAFTALKKSIVKHETI